MSIQAMVQGFALRLDDPLAKFLLITLANYANEDGLAYPSLRRLADDTGMSRQSISNKIKVLIELNLITVQQVKTPHGVFSHNIYHLASMQQGVGNVVDHPPTTLPSGPPDRHNPTKRDLLVDTPPTQTEPLIERVVVPKQTRAARLPDGFAPSARDLEWCRSSYPKLEPTHETDKFRDYWIARGAAKLDWNAAWRNWIRRAAEYAVSRPAVLNTRAGLSDRNINRVESFLARLDQGEKTSR